MTKRHKPRHAAVHSPQHYCTVYEHTQWIQRLRPFKTTQHVLGKVQQSEEIHQLFMQQFQHEKQNTKKVTSVDQPDLGQTCLSDSETTALE